MADSSAVALVAFDFAFASAGTLIEKVANASVALGGTGSDPLPGKSLSLLQAVRAAAVNVISINRIFFIFRWFSLVFC